jgi:MFS family permease
MVQNFYPDKPLSSLGVELGLLASSFNIGQFISSIIWGKLSDRIGRRPVLIAGLFGTVLGKN